MKNFLKSILLILLLAGVTNVVSVQPASAFSLNPIKAIKKVAKAAVNVAKTTVKTVEKTAVKVGTKVGQGASKVGGAALKVGGSALKFGGNLALNTAHATDKAIKSTGKGLLASSNFLKSAANSAKDPFKAIVKASLLGTPLAPVLVASQTYNAVKNPPKLRDLAPRPPTLAGIRAGINREINNPRPIGQPLKPTIATAPRPITAGPVTSTGKPATGAGAKPAAVASSGPAKPVAATSAKPAATATAKPATAPALAAAKPAMATVAKPAMAMPKPAMAAPIGGYSRNR